MITLTDDEFVAKDVLLAKPFSNKNKTRNANQYHRFGDEV